MKHITFHGLLVVAVALALAGCGGSGSSNSGTHEPQDNSVDIQGTVIGVKSHDYTCSVAIDRTTAKHPIAAIGAGINTRNEWTISVTKNESYSFVADCNGRSNAALPSASGRSGMVKATATQTHHKIVIHVHTKS